MSNAVSPWSQVSRLVEPPRAAAAHEPLTTDFRLFLQGELIRRCRHNPQYSLRAFARFLRVDHSSLSQMLRGKRRISHEVRCRFGERLGLTPAEITARFGNANEEGDGVAPGSIQELSVDAFQVIADWYHYAIFELVTVKHFRAEPKWIARTLGISINEVHIAVERLFRLGLLTKDDLGHWRQGAPFITTTGIPFSHVALRRLQAQVLEMALRAMEDVPLDRRDQSSMTIALSSKRLEEAKERIRHFRRSLCAFLQQDTERDEVYQIGISFYPLTRDSEGGLL